MSRKVKKPLSRPAKTDEKKFVWQVGEATVEPGPNMGATIPSSELFKDVDENNLFVDMMSEDPE